MSEEKVDLVNNKGKVSYLSKLRHELKTPIHGVQGLAEYLLNNWDETTPETQKRCLQSILEASDRLMELVDALSNENSDQTSIEFSFKEVDLIDITKSTIRNFQNIHLVRSQIKLKVNFHIDSFITNADEFWYNQLLTNLLTNSLNYSDKGIITVNIRSKIIKNAEHLIISVIDEGVGIPESELASIFTPFNRSSRTNESTEGSGLGLSICREIVQAHGGIITAMNNDKIGSTVEFSSPKTR